MKLKILITLSCFFDILVWVGLLALTVQSDLQLKWMFFIAIFGGFLIVIFGGWLCQNLAEKHKKRHATLIKKNNTRFLKANT